MLDTGAQIREMEYEPRPLQRHVHANLKRFNALVCHRAFGKTVLTINQLISSGLQCRDRQPKYSYVAPLRNQAKSVAWDALLHYSAPFRKDEPNIAELRVDLYNGARIQLFGAENPNALRGIHPHGAVFDEYGDMDPTAWTQVVSPSLSTHNGFVIFIGTPKGKNGFHDIYQAALNDNSWYAAMFKASETGILSPEELARLRKQLSEEEYAQELECSFNSPNVGAYYGKEMQSAADDKRIIRLPWEPVVPVTTAWDLGMDDATAIWCVQQVGREVRVIDYYENSGEGLTHYANWLKSKAYVYGDHLLPHDAAVKELGTGLSRVEVLQSLGINPTIIPAQSVEDGINAVRMLLPRCWFDADKCTRGIKALQSYQREWVPKMGTWRSSPRHDGASHGADAFRYLALGLRPPAVAKPLAYPKGIYV